jgi:hypothetical protein
MMENVAFAVDEPNSPIPMDAAPDVPAWWEVVKPGTRDQHSRTENPFSAVRVVMFNVEGTDGTGTGSVLEGWHNAVVTLARPKRAMKQRLEILKGPIPLDFEMSSYVVWRCLFLKTLQSSWKTEVLIYPNPVSSAFATTHISRLSGFDS